MKPVKMFPLKNRSAIRYLLTDIDDTITTNGRIPACAFQAMESLDNAGIKLIPITGRPAGWCDHIARMWPVKGIVGENGAFYYVYDAANKKMIQRYFKTKEELSVDKKRLEKIKNEVLASVPGCAISSDQPFRTADLAVDFCEDVAPLSQDEINRITHIFEAHGATAKVSSIHVNGWFGEYDKLTMTKLLFSEVFDTNLDAIKENVAFIGDSPNDEPMFEYFSNAVGVANVLAFKDQLVSKPAWITTKRGGKGFAELAAILV
ncbi:MAG: HAD-IIB family hydrolase [Desulfobacteraceae bacterium]|nr:HAD-IIB family hydrolase [Desulfobacteraceae bacterium]